MQPPPHPSVHAMAVVLRAGTALSTVLLALGMVIALVVPGAVAGQALLTGGLVILMMTPVAHLLVAIVDEITAKEWGFVAIGVVVLLLLGVGLLVAFS